MLHGGQTVKQDSNFSKPANKKGEALMIIDLVCPECGHQFQADKQPVGETTSKTGPSMFPCPNCGHVVMDVRPVDISDLEFIEPNSPRPPQARALEMGKTTGTWTRTGTGPDDGDTLG
jgi:predicted RNA-binding Zn-ribbon protein involved in translation (DUF1610 family)